MLKCFSICLHHSIPLFPRELYFYSNENTQIGDVSNAKQVVFLKISVPLICRILLRDTQEPFVDPAAFLKMVWVQAWWSDLTVFGGKARCSATATKFRAVAHMFKCCKIWWICCFAGEQALFAAVKYVLVRCDVC